MRRPIFSILLFVSFALFKAQNIAISPYSGLGVGDIKFDQSAIYSAMAGTSSTASSEYGSEANFFNPAANRNLAFTAYSAELATDAFNFKTYNGLDTDRSTTYISNLNIAFPINQKVKVGIGFQPFSGIGYDVSRLYENDEPAKRITLNGDGGLNSVHSFVSYNVNKELSVGLRANYLFGNNTRHQKVYLEDANVIADYDNHTKLRGLMFTPGIMYEKKIKDNQYVTIGSTYTFKTNLNPFQTFLNSTYYLDNDQQKINQDTIAYFKGDTQGDLSSVATLGLAFHKTTKYRVAIEGQYFSKPNYTFDRPFYELQEGYKLAFGSWIIPDANSYKSYFQKVVYRFGAYFQKGNIKYNYRSLEQFGITFGFGLPVGNKGKDPSMINIAVDLGRRGTQANGLIQEDFVNLKFGFNFNDVWFQRRKYN